MTSSAALAEPRAAAPEPTAAPAPSRVGFYYGWVNVAVAAVAMSATLPGRTYGLGLVKEPLRAELALGDLEFNVLNFWAVVIGAVLVLPAGRLIDGLGGRLTLGLVAALLGGSVLAMAWVRDERELAVTLTLVRGLGQGALSVVAIALVGKWFRRRAGIAMGVFTVLLSVGFVGPLMLVGAAVAELGWRAAWAAVGVALLAGLLPLGLLLARDSPESLGVPPDEPALDGDCDSAAPLAMSPSQALATPAFWVYTAAATLFNLTLSAVTLDSEALLREHALAEAGANQTVLGVLMFAGLPANLLAGYAARFVSLGRLLAVGLLLLAASLAVFPFVASLAGAAGYAALLGVAGGVITVVYFAVYGSTYGRAHLGSIQSMVQVLTVLASAVGPVILAAVRESCDGRTDAFFWASCAAAVCVAGLAAAVAPPRVTEADPKS